MPLLLEIVTPDKKVYSEMVDHVVVPTKNGEIDVLPGHIPLLSIVEAGELKVGQNGATVSMAVDKGFVQVLGDKVSILTEAAINVESIDLNEVEEARLRAEEALRDARVRNEDPETLLELETRAQFALVQRLIKQKR